MNNSKYYDVVISGAGINGMITAIALSQLSISTALIDKNKILLSIPKDRVFALSRRSQEILDKFNIWNNIKEHCPILDILIKDEDSSIFTHYDHKSISDNPMGYIVESKFLCDAFKKHIKKINLYSECTYKSVNITNDLVRIELTDNTILLTSLLISAEGKNSTLRQIFDIPSINHDYSQSSIICNIKHTNHHNNLAIEHFFHGGPFAILPMYDGYRSSVVWTNKTQISEMLMKLKKQDFMAELEKKCAPYVNDIKLDSEIKCFPLHLMFAKHLYKNRFALIGDAAHSIHPIAGQGLNLGIRDIDKLVNHIKSAKQYGIDIGSNYVLKNFSYDRYFDNSSMAILTTLIDGIFTKKSCTAKIARRFGLFIVQNSKSIKNYMIKHAMGIGKFN
ncbi:ubiquinone biosynthesis hydroxylase, UbiH/UbiF/VisC/COQ6 family protein [Ehrlichia chaffeensis str. Heartland]|uniref:Ubiquinone biosynthesis hydroxylase, UbiH/UbiF/VisC/COQ6 family n=1 Tax=Ehrlichia chaffeensis (strain ATCC CRL-10679 / Arkansas) TaxID=205920 RepID=Q2GI79_EHRCR|nr:FAD-dependent monooxygenase [Ehrlichia chaffeensis]ABD44863.1 ubiquinone biosynthesis hydroxylase, UbiH/UbiF/VisC/COQ6 family [Ehrlichia chaffeensis str. Arkansas]AHX03190.1 ubiquinone biosynthesis hydroxylase, UbiH/UbiF/VisC/COQ6 family protein [Ehrlichia chaffeensis str. Heartland]AHX05106.1 ubiquinone biosynthesis hydroxylase, UbiH/UbiF/VisC/COQ6 family protein [Ehrlichia chaffeensis str. Jax]AHX06095.1 ubiquinone biosynthesis hydroxylase, UbiH/UbiF/VisC/COQ6 family protein [Ehrlichia cha